MFYVILVTKLLVSRHTLLHLTHQRFCFGRYIGYFPPNIIYFYDLCVYAIILWHAKVPRESSISSEMEKYICVRKIEAMGRVWSCLGGWVVWQRLACPVEYVCTFQKIQIP